MKRSELHDCMNASVTPRAHDVEAYIVETFADVLPGLFLDLQALLKCPLTSQLCHTDLRAGYLSLLWGAPPQKLQFLLGCTAANADASGASEHEYMLSSGAEMELL